MKFYFIELQHKISKHVFYKFGITNSRDVLERFSNRYPERVGYQNFNIRVLFSINLKNFYAKFIEEEYLKRYPKIINILAIVKDNFNYNYKNTSGISEWRSLSISQKNSLLKELYKRFPKN